MNDIQLKGEIWEVQVWLMWILALLLKETNHTILFFLVLVWSIISSVGVLIKTHQGKTKELEEVKTLSE